MMVSIALVEDHYAFRQALALMLGKEPDFEVSEQAGSLAEARHCDLDSTDVAIIDIFLPDGDGVELIRELAGQQGRPRVVALTTSFDPEVHRRARQAGAEEVLTKDALFTEIISLIRRLADRSGEDD
jgi:DNA-binding NarL/FixJ family response regulator